MKGLLVKDFLLMRKSKYVILFMLAIGIIGESKIFHLRQAIS